MVELRRNGPADSPPLLGAPSKQPSSLVLLLSLPSSHHNSHPQPLTTRPAAIMALSVDQKRLKSTKFPPEFDQKVDIKKVEIDLMKKWIANRITTILGDEDDVVIDTCYNMLEQSQFVRWAVPLPASLWLMSCDSRTSRKSRSNSPVS